VVTKWSDLLQRQVTRQQFLRVLGGGVLVALNLEGIARLLQHGGTTTKSRAATPGYGSGSYGGGVNVRQPVGTNRKLGSSA
jgi:hypothetical protein